MHPPNSLLGHSLTISPIPYSPTQGQALNLDQSASLGPLFSLCCRVRGSSLEQVHHTGLRSGRCRHLALLSEEHPPLPVSRPYSAGSCPCWLGQPPTLPGLAGRRQTHRASSHCRSTARAKALLVEAAARLPLRHLPPPGPSSVELDQILFPEQAQALLPCQPGGGNTCAYALGISIPLVLPEAGRCQAPCEHRMNESWGLLSEGKEADRHDNPNRQPRFLDLFPCSECWIKITKKISQHCSSAIL